MHPPFCVMGALGRQASYSPCFEFLCNLHASIAYKEIERYVMKVYIFCKLW